MTQRVRHIALFRWKAGVDVDLPLLERELRKVVDLVDGASDLVAGRGLGLSGATGLDFGLSVDFVDAGAYQTYRQHPDHQRLLAEVLLPAAESVYAIQVRLDE